jgi:ArsR family transcriptional regulator
MHENYADIFKCFAHRSRINLMKLLASADELSVMELAKELGLKHSTISKHLNILRLQGLANFRREGQLKYYSLNLGEIEEVFQDFLRFLKAEEEEELLEAVSSRSGSGG